MLCTPDRTCGVVAPHVEVTGVPRQPGHVAAINATQVQAAVEAEAKVQAEEENSRLLAHLLVHVAERCVRICTMPRLDDIEFIIFIFKYSIEY